MVRLAPMTLRLLALLGVLGLPAADLAAQQIVRRTGPDPAAAATISRARAEAARQQARSGKTQALTNPAGCGVNIGTVETRGAGAPRQVTTVVTGSVVNICNK